MLNEIKSLNLPLETLSIPIMIALLARIQDQLLTDETTSDVAEVLSLVIATLFDMREQAEKVMLEADATRRRDFPSQMTATPALHS